MSSLVFNIILRTTYIFRFKSLIEIEPDSNHSYLIIYMQIKCRLWMIWPVRKHISFKAWYRLIVSQNYDWNVTESNKQTNKQKETQVLLCKFRIADMHRSRDYPQPISILQILFYFILFYLFIFFFFFAYLPRLIFNTSFNLDRLVAIKRTVTQDEPTWGESHRWVLTWKIFNWSMDWLDQLCSQLKRSTWMTCALGRSRNTRWNHIVTNISFIVVLESTAARLVAKNQKQLVLFGFFLFYFVLFCFWKDK